MATKTLSSDQARTHWRDLLDSAMAGHPIVIERHGKPAVAVIAYEDFIELQDALDDLRDSRLAESALQEWRQDPSRGKHWEQVKEELIAEGLLDE